MFGRTLARDTPFGLALLGIPQLQRLDPLHLVVVAIFNGSGSTG
jgi:hypothetical protein